MCSPTGSPVRVAWSRAERDGRVWYDLIDEFGVHWSMPDDQKLYMDVSFSPLADATIKDVRDYPWPKGDDPARFAGLRDRALRIRRETPYAVVSGITASARVRRSRVS